MAGERPVEFLDLDDLIDLARRLLGDPPPLRDVGLLTSAVARPQTTVGGNAAYPTIWLKAAALLQSVVGNDALVDGNKRLGWLATAVFLDINQASVASATNDDVYTLVMQMARSEPALARSPTDSSTSPTNRRHRSTGRPGDESALVRRLAGRHAPRTP